jgi:hypothetical protein
MVVSFLLMVSLLLLVSCLIAVVAPFLCNSIGGFILLHSHFSYFTVFLKSCHFGVIPLKITMVVAFFLLNSVGCFIFLLNSHDICMSVLIHFFAGSSQDGTLLLKETKSARAACLDGYSIKSCIRNFGLCKETSSLLHRPFQRS